MKKTYIIIVLAFLSINSFAQAPNWQWAKRAMGSSNDVGNSVCTDASGNVYMTGYFYSRTITFGPVTLTNTDTTGNTPDVFIVKYNATGWVVWAKSAGGGTGGEDYGEGVSTDASGNVFITGYFEDAITFGTTTLTGAGFSDIFIVKYNASGNVLWAKSEGGGGIDESYGVSTDASGNVFLSGYSQSNIITIGTTTFFPSNGDVILVKFSASGNVLWVKSVEGGYGKSVATDTSGNVFITGYFGTPYITFGPTATLTKNGTEDVFIAKYDALGNLLWARSAGGYCQNISLSLATDAIGNAFMTGYFTVWTITFGGIPVGNSGGGQDIFIVKYDASGNAIWAQSAGGGMDKGYSVSPDSSGNVFMTGVFQGSITFGTFTLNTVGYDIFIVKYDATGNVLWAKSAGGGYDDEGHCVSTDASGNVFLTGFFHSPSIAFGAALSNTDFTGSTSDVFIAKLNGTVGITVGIEELNNSIVFNISPNPFTSQTNISFNEEQKNTSIKITDVLGKEIKTINFSGKQCTIEKGEMLPGIYFVRVVDSQKNIVNRKIVVQ